MPQPAAADLAGESSSRRMLCSCVLTDQGFCFRKPWSEMFFTCFRRFSAQPGCLWSFTRRAPKVTRGNLELATAGLASTGSPSWAVPGALVSICREGGLEMRFSLWAGAGWWARGDLGVLSRSQLWTGCQQGNRIREVVSVKKEALHFLNDCLRKCDCGMWRAGRILDPT